MAAENAIKTQLELFQEMFDQYVKLYETRIANEGRQYYLNHLRPDRNNPSLTREQVAVEKLGRLLSYMKQFAEDDCEEHCAGGGCPPCHPGPMSAFVQRLNELWQGNGATRLPIDQNMPWKEK